jgi:hypothetical protein
MARVKEQNLEPSAQPPGIREITNLATDAPKTGLAAAVNTNVQTELAGLQQQYNQVLANNTAAQKAAADKAAADKSAADKAEADAKAAAEAKAKYDKEQEDAVATAKAQQEKNDAFQKTANELKFYGFDPTEMAQIQTFITNSLIDPKLGPNQIVQNMRELPAYQKRFAGNTQRLANGLNALSEADYITQENAYGSYLKQYGLQSLGTRDEYAGLIGNNVSGTEVKERAALAVDRVKNADPAVMQQLRAYYPSITDSDLATYFLKPTELLPELTKKVTSAEIGAAALGQGINVSGQRAQELATMGVDKAGAITGYQNVADVLPTAQNLSNIYNQSGINYNQTTAESEFLNSNTDAARKRKQLASLERGTFSSDSGQTNTAFASKNYSLNNTSAGQY